LLMTWQMHPEVADIRSSFQIVLQQLMKSQQPMYLLVDLRQNVSMPLSETISSALFGAYTHPNLSACLIIGGHSRIHIVGNIIQRISRQNKILYFRDETEAYAYIENKGAGNGT
jgi:hypothetical protein